MCSMHWLSRILERLVIKVEVANFGAAMDTLIDQDVGTMEDWKYELVIFSHCSKHTLKLSVTLFFTCIAI